MVALIMGKTIKNNTLVVKFGSSKGLAKPKKNEIYLAELDEYYRLMIPQRLEIINVLKHTDIDSLYRLAKVLDRSLHTVASDCELLEEAGFLVIEENKTTKKITKVPRLRFDYSKIKIFSPNGLMEISFTKATLVK